MSASSAPYQSFVVYPYSSIDFASLDNILISTNPDLTIALWVGEPGGVLKSPATIIITFLSPTSPSVVLPSAVSLSWYIANCSDNIFTLINCRVTLPAGICVEQ